MKCPACQAVLVVVEREEIEVDWCTQCRGLWFDHGELELLVEKAGRSLKTQDLGRRAGETVEKGRRRCPRCPRRMERLVLQEGADSQVEIDRCADHGFWLDSGELGTIMNRLELESGTDEGLVLEFLGETFGGGEAMPTPPEGSRP